MPTTPSGTGYQSVLLNVINPITLNDLGGRNYTAGTYDIGTEYDIDEIRNSKDLYDAIVAGNATVEGAHQDGISGNSPQLRIIINNTNPDDLEFLFHSKNTDQLEEGSSNLFYTDSRARNAISLASSANGYLTYNNTTGELGITQLSITDVTVDNTATGSLASPQSALEEYLLGITSTTHQEGDTIVLAAAAGGPETWMYFGSDGSDATDSANYVRVSGTDIDEQEMRSLISGIDPIDYNAATGAISLDNKANGGLIVEATELAVDLSATNITGTLAVGDGGTGQTSFTSDFILLGNGAGAIQETKRGDLDSEAGNGSTGATYTGASAIDSKITFEGTSPVVAEASSIANILVGTDVTIRLQEDKINLTDFFGDLTAGNMIGYTSGAQRVTYTATNPADWPTVSPDPSDAQGAIDELASRVQDIENVAVNRETWSFGAASTSNNNTNRYLDRHDGVQQTKLLILLSILLH